MKNFIFITGSGRCGTTLVRSILDGKNTFNVYPKEIESIIDKIEGVQESAVIGLNDEDLGEKVVAIIVSSEELTLDESKPTLAILGSKDGGGKLMVATTENSIASERYNSVDILQFIIQHISGGGGGRPTFAQGGGSNPDGLQDSFDAAKSLLDI